MPDAAETTITALGAGGDGMATLPGGEACFIPRALPGERVRIGTPTRRAGALHAPLQAVLAPSPERRDPPCPHFAEGCGGCALQHWAPEAEAGWKRRRLAGALSRAGFPDAPVAETIVTPPGRRRRADLALRREGNAIRLGFHKAGSAEILDLASCLVLDPALVALFRPLRTLARRLTALRKEGSAVLNLLDTGPDLLLRTDGDLSAEDRSLLAAFGAVANIPRIAWAQKDAPAEVAAQRGPATIVLSGAELAPAPGAFLQASPDGQAAIIAAMLEGLPAKLGGRGRIADLHAGLGTLSFALAGRGRVTAYEGDAAAIAALNTAAGRAEAKRVTGIRRDLDRQPLTVADLAPFAAVVLDPPYNGAAEQVPLLARSNVQAVIYVSCNPAALARDGRAFSAAGWKVSAATPIDQFLYSAQLEAVVVFTKG